MIARVRIAFALAFLTLAPTVSAKEAQVLAFSFELPNSWYVESGGGRLFAMGSTTPYRPPLITAEACIPTTSQDCSGMRRPFPPGAPGSKALGCDGIIPATIPRQGGITETRCICSPVVVDSDPGSVGFSVFHLKGAVLFVGYFAGVNDQDVESFLDALAGSVRVR